MSAPDETAETESEASTEDKASFGVIGLFMPYLWPKDRPSFKLRIVLATICLVLAKVSNVYAPLFFKDAIDALENKPELAIAAPLGIIFAYGLVRIGATLFGEIREALFAAVAQGAIRGVGLDVFRHLHNLSLRFHL